jgi:hypothetical protein
VVGLPGRGRLVSQTDRFECELCKREWDEVAFPKAETQMRVTVEV